MKYLKKLNLSNNGIETLFRLPSELEILNLSYNKIKQLSPKVTSTLKRISTLDLT